MRITMGVLMFISCDPMQVLLWDHCFRARDCHSNHYFRPKALPPNQVARPQRTSAAHQISAKNAHTNAPPVSHPALFCCALFVGVGRRDRGWVGGWVGG